MSNACLCGFDTGTTWVFFTCWLVYVLCPSETISLKIMSSTCAKQYHLVFWCPAIGLEPFMSVLEVAYPSVHWVCLTIAWQGCVQCVSVLYGGDVAGVGAAVLAKVPFVQMGLSSVVSDSSSAVPGVCTCCIEHQDSVSLHWERGYGIDPSSACWHERLGLTACVCLGSHWTSSLKICDDTEVALQW